MSKVVRSVKNVTKGYSTIQVKVRNATSNDPWGPTGTEMSEIAAMTFNNSADFLEVMDMLDKRLNDKGKNWRHVLKSLKVLDYCLHEGSELVVTWASNNIYIIKTLREFQYIDEEGRDVGQNVRASAKELTSLILDRNRLQSERSDRKLWKSRVSGFDDLGPLSTAGPSDRPRENNRRKDRTDEDDIEYRLAIEASKHEAEEEKKRRDNSKNTGDDDDLAKAIKMSKEEEEQRRRELEEQNASSLFNDNTPVPTQPQPTGWNQGYQQQGAVDWFGNPIQQPMSTGYLNNQYSQPTQQTGYQNGYTNGFTQQPTGYEQFQQPQLQQQPSYMQPQSTIQPQQTALGNNPYAQPQQQQQPQQQPQPTGDVYSQPSSGSLNPWANNHQQQAESLKPMPTGSNNPFAPRPQAIQNNTSPAPLNTLYEQKTANTKSNQPAQTNPITNFQAPQPPSSAQASLNPSNQKPTNPQHARLNALLASGEGQDTFGNVGDLRIPAQHTAPGTFVNSGGSGLDRLRAAQTGTNPFYQQQQLTGAGAGVGVGASQQGGMQGLQAPTPQQQQMPAQTGPNSFGGFGSGGGQSNNNPFGPRPGQQPATSSLIDL